MTSMVIIARLLLYVGSLIAIGESSAQWVRGADWRSRMAPGENGRSLVAWLAVLVALLLMFVAQFLALELAPTVQDVAMLVRQTTWGNGWLVLAACAVAGTVATGVRASLAVRVAIVVALAIAMGGLGHAAADDVPLLSRSLDAIHVISIGAWLGTLLCIGGNPTAEAWSRFSRMAVIAAPLTVLTGLGSALRRVSGATVEQTLASDYGRLLVWKLAIVAIVVVLGAWHRRQLQARRAPAFNSVRLELVLALVVLGVTAVLTGTAPPGE